MVGKEEPRGREAKPRTRHLLPIPLRLNILHPLLPDNLGIDRILHDGGDPVPLLRLLSATGRRERGGDGALDRFPPPRKYRRETEEDLSGGDGEGLLNGRRRVSGAAAAAALLVGLG